MSEEKTIERISGTGQKARFKITGYIPPVESGEVFPEFDQEGKIIGAVARSEAHKNPERIHGGVRIFIVDPTTAEVYLPKRSEEKDKDPGCLDYGGGEHSTVDRKTGELETWTQTARRGLKEEVGLSPDQYRLRRIPRHELDRNDPNQTEWGTFYVAEVSKDKPLFLNPEEINRGGWVPIQGLLAMVDGQPVEDQNLAGQKLRPMLVNDLQIPYIRKVLEKYLEER